MPISLPGFEGLTAKFSQQVREEPAGQENSAAARTAIVLRVRKGERCIAGAFSLGTSGRVVRELGILRDRKC